MSIVPCPCTAAVTEHSLHRKPTTAANVEVVFTLQFTLCISQNGLEVFSVLGKDKFHM